MKTVSKFICTAGLVGIAATASAQVFQGDLFRDTSNPNPGKAIPDGDLNGVVLSDNVNIHTPVDINRFTVYLDVAGDPVGANGDLNIFIKSPGANGVIAQLVNRPGVTGTNPLGYQDNGIHVDFYDGADPSGASHTDFHYYQNDPVYGVISDTTGVTGVFKTDGRDLDPLPVTGGSAFDTAGRTKTLAGFQGIDPYGDWTLFAVDVSSGGSSIIKDWGIDFSPIPEPQSYAMVIGAGLMAFGIYRRRTLKSA